MIFAQRKGADYKAEEIFRKIRLEENIGARDKNVRKSGLIYNEDPWGKKKIVTPDDIRKQKMNLNGHLLKDGDFRLRCSEYLAEVYEEFLRMYQLASEMAKSGKVMRTATGRAVTGISFNDWIFENKLTLMSRKKELKRAFQHGKISKEMYDFHEEIRRKSIEYCDKYISAGKATQITMV